MNVERNESQPFWLASSFDIANTSRPVGSSSGMWLCRNLEDISRTFCDTFSTELWRETPYYHDSIYFIVVIVKVVKFPLAIFSTRNYDTISLDFYFWI